MARQSVIRPLLALLVLAGCEEDEPYEGAFDMPTGLSVLTPDHGPFEQPVGFVANGVGGQIVPLDLKYGRFLTDDPTASFLRTNFLATGGARVLTDVAAWAPSETEVTLFAADRAFSTLLRVPYVIGLDEQGFPLEGFFVGEEAHFDPFVADVRAEVSGDATLADDIELKNGYSATETWTVEFVPERRAWQVTGSRSGPQDEMARPGQRFVAAKRRIAFTVQGRGEPGDRFEIDVENGVRELDVGGNPFVLEMSPDHTILAMSVQTDGASVLRWFDPADETLIDVPLAADSAPGRMDWSQDGFDLIVSDNQRPAIWEVPADGSGAIEHPMPWPTMDVTPLYTLEEGRLVYVVPVTGLEVWIYDLDSRTFRDVNTTQPGVQGMEFLTPVLGVEAIPLRHLFRDRDNAGDRRSGASVAVSLHRGGVVFMEHPTGCLQQDEFGPRSEIVRGTFGAFFDFTTNFDDTNGPALQRNQGDDRHVVVNRCAGIAHAQEWTLRFDRIRGGWVVEGTLSGVQEALAFEDERYVSDRGEVSFLIRAGSQPTQDGWEFVFRVLDGALIANGLEDTEEGEDIPFSMPGDPVFFSYTVGPTDRAWDDVDERAFVLVPAQASDVVGRVDPQEGDVEVAWD